MKKKLVTLLIIFSIILSFSIPVGATADRKSVIVVFKNTPDAGLIRAHGGDIKYQYDIIPGIAVNMPITALKGLQNHPNIAYIEDDIQVHAQVEILPWGVNRIDADMVWGSDGIPQTYTVVNTGAGVNIAVLDTGIDADHPDLYANVKGGINFVSKPPWKPADSTKWDDDNGHGTHVAGTIAAMDNDIGVIGVAPDANLHGVKVLDSSGSGYLSGVIAGIDWAKENDMDIITMSLSASLDEQAFQDACDSAYVAGIVIVAAAGNDYGESVKYPAAYDSVIAVSATDSNDNLADYSNVGPQVELAAPGSSIYSTYKGGIYGTMSGTSMATPHVTGVAALVIASNFAEYGNNPGAVSMQLASTAEDLGSNGWDTSFGFGLVDAEAATVSLVTLESIAVTPETASISKGLTLQYTATGTYSDDSTADITSSVTWASSNTAVATIDLAAGLATGVSDGSTDITATLGLISGTATLTVTAPILQSITVMPDSATIEVAANQQYTATGTYSDASTADITSSVTWASSNTAVATIDPAAGLATGVGDGSTDITATLDLVSDTAALTVTLALNSIAVTPVIATIPKGLTQQYTATGTYSDDSTADITSSVTWASSNTAVATIDPAAGLATGVSDGSTDITATLGLISGTATLTVTAPILQSITVMPDSATIEVAANQQYTATGTYSDASTADITSSVTWASSNTAVATIDPAAGLATGVGDGSTDITATLDLVSDTAALTVTAPSGPTTVSVNGISYNTEGGGDGNKHLLITVVLEDNLYQPVGSASVSINVNLDESLYGSGTGTTGTDGTVTFKFPNAPSGPYTTKVTGVTAVGLDWDDFTPENSHTK